MNDTIRGEPMNDTTTTILRAAANILRDDALDRVTEAKTTEERDCVNAGLLASIAVEKYLDTRDVLDRPF